MKDMIDPAMTAYYQSSLNAPANAKDVMASKELFDDMREFITDTINENPGSRVVNIDAPELLAEFKTSPDMAEVRSTISTDIAFRLKDHEVFDYYEHNAFADSELQNGELVGMEQAWMAMDQAAQRLQAFNNTLAERVLQETGREVINFIGMSKTGQFFAVVK